MASSSLKDPAGGVPTGSASVSTGDDGYAWNILLTSPSSCRTVGVKHQKVQAVIGPATNNISHAVHKVRDTFRFIVRAKRKFSTLALKFKIVREMNLDGAELNQHLRNLFNEASAMNGDDKDVPFSGLNETYSAAAPASAQVPAEEPPAPPTDTVDEMCEN